MWLDDEHYIIKNDDFFPLNSHQYLMDKTGFLYVYDYKSDKAIYYSHATVYDSNLNTVHFDETKSESFLVSYDSWTWAETKEKEGGEETTL